LFLIFNEQILFFYFFILITLLGFLFLFLVRLFSGVNRYPYYREKYSPYECGFIPYDDARNKFEVHFYIIALLFVLFDVELILLLP
jgi:NADH:ubiquinone oxidoreductase subunit 3 (subunit A)